MTKLHRCYRSLPNPEQRVRGEHAEREEVEKPGSWLSQCEKLSSGLSRAHARKSTARATITVAVNHGKRRNAFANNGKT